MKAAAKSYDFVKKEVERQSQKDSEKSTPSKNSPNPKQSGDSPSQPSINASSTMKDAEAFEKEGGKKSKTRNTARSEHYISDDDTTSALTER